MNRPAACRPPVASNTRCAARSTVRQGQDAPRGATTGPAGSGVAADRDLVERRLAADPARRRRDEVPLRDERRVERARQTDRGPSSSGWASARRVPERRRRTTSEPSISPSVRRNPTASSASWPGVRIVTATVDRLLPGTGRADRHGLLAHEPVRASLDASTPEPPRSRHPRCVGSGPSSTRMAPQSIAGIYERTMDRTTLTDAELAFLRPVPHRRARDAATPPVGRDSCPICFVVAPELDARGRLVLHTPIDEKPKQSDDPLSCQRVQDLLVLPRVTLLVDRWAEDWSKLAWLRLYGRGEAPGAGAARGGGARGGDRRPAREVRAVRGRIASRTRPIIRIDDRACALVAASRTGAGDVRHRLGGRPPSTATNATPASGRRQWVDDCPGGSRRR